MRFIHPRNYELRGFNGQLFQLVGNPGAVNGIERDYNPWEFVVFALRSRETFPYGMPVIEKMRVKYEQLLVMEQLLAICRDSKRQKLVISVDTGNSDPATSTQKLSQMKSNWKNIMFGGEGARQTRNADQSMTEYIWTTDKFTVKNIENSLDVSSTEDVEYFREQVITSSRLPRGYFISDNADHVYGSALKMQDAKFGKSLLPVIKDYENCLVNLIKLIAFYLGADLDKLRVKVYLSSPGSVNETSHEDMERAIKIMTDYVNLRKLANPNAEISDKQLYHMCAELNLPPEIFGLKNEIKAKDEIKTTGEDKKYLSGKPALNNPDEENFEEDNFEEIPVGESIKKFISPLVQFSDGSKMQESLYNALRLSREVIQC